MGIRTVLLTMALIIFSSCSIMKDDMLSLERMDYTGMDIRLDGYWWKNLEGAIEPSRFVLFLYNNGIALSGLSFPVDELAEKEAEYKSKIFRDAVLRSKTGWGVFSINGKDIEIEMWASSNGGPLKTVIRSGEILNDGTFVITSFLNNYSGETSARNDTFYFKEFSPKPDSTNVFIK